MNLFSDLGKKGKAEGRDYDLKTKDGKTIISTDDKEIKRLVDELMKQGE